MAARKAFQASSLLRLAILSLLTERPMHPYEIAAVMRMREMAVVMSAGKSSLYATIEALARDELIVPMETRREGRYPERTVYTATDTGRAELARWLRELLRSPGQDVSPFAAGLAFMGFLSPSEVATLLEEHLRRLDDALAHARATIEKGRQYRVDPVFLVEDAYIVTLLEARHAFVERLVQEINDGTLTETVEGEQRWRIEHPELALLQDPPDEERERHDEQGQDQSGDE